MKKNMYVVIVMFALALLSPLPFVSPFTSVYADELPFQTQPSSNVPTPDSPVKTSATDGSVELVASQIAPDTIVIKALVNNEPSFGIVANSTEIPFNFSTDVFRLSGSDNNGNVITDVNSESWFAHEHIEYSFIENGTSNIPLLINPVDEIPLESRNYDEGLRFGSSMTNLGDIDGDGIDDVAIGSSGDGDILKLFRSNNGTIVDGRYSARDQGAFYILLMNDDNTIKSSTKFDHTTKNMPSLATDFLLYDSALGSSIVSLGDVYNDGTIVLAVGAPVFAPIRQPEGGVFIMHLGDGGTTILDTSTITLRSLGIVLPDDSKFGSALANIGDVDNNGVPDLAVGAYGVTLGTSSDAAGGMFILHMGENATSVLDVTSISGNSNTPQSNQISLSTSWRFGNSITLLETYDDGTTSLAVGAPYSGPSDAERIGSIFIINLTDQATIVSSVRTLDYTTPVLSLNERNYNIDGLYGFGADILGGFGFSLQNLGDLNGNGVNDILVGYTDLNSIGGAYIVYMNSDNSVQHTAKFQIDRIESENGTDAILADDADRIDNFRKYFNYSDPPNMPTSIFQTHYSSKLGEISAKYFEFGSAVVNFGDVHNDGYTDIGFSSPGHNSGTILVLNRLGPVVNVTFDPTDVDTIHYRPTATDFITVNGIELHNNLDITVDNNIRPTIVNITLQSPGTFTITFDTDINASSVSITDFVINGIVYTGTVAVSGAVVTLNVDGVFTTDTVNTVSIVDEVLDLFGSAVAPMHSSSTVPVENMNIVASRIDKTTITLNFTNISSLSSDNTNVNAFLVTGATVISWSITGTVITIATSGLTGTHETPIIVYDPSHSTNLATSTGTVDYISITTVDKIPPEYIETLATGITTLEIQFSEQLGASDFNIDNFTLDPNYIINTISIMNYSLVVNTINDITQLPTVTYSASIRDSVGNTNLQSSTTVFPSDAFGPKLSSARTVDVNKINIVFYEQFTQTVFDKSSVDIRNLEIKDVIQVNQTALQVITEQFSSNYIPGEIRITTDLTDNDGNFNQFGDRITDNIKDGVGPTPYALYPGYYPEATAAVDYFNRHHRTIFFDESVQQLNPSSTSLTLYDASGTPLPAEHQFENVLIVGNLVPNLIRGENYNYDLDTVGISFVNITGVIRDNRGVATELGAILHQYDFEIPALTSAKIMDDNTITVMFDKIINYSTVSIQDFTVNNTITISDVLTRGNTVYLTTDSLLPGESYNVSLVGSVADYFNNATNTTSIAILYETVIAENFTITSSNANPTYAKSGDTLTINLTIDETLTSASATVLENNVQYASTDKTITINTVVPENAVDGFATFAIYVETVNGSTRTFAQNDLTDNSNVLIDNTNPSFVSSSYDFNKLVHLTFSENISSASAYEHDNNNEILTTINGSVVTLNTSLIQNTSTIINATVYDYAGNSYSHLPTNIDSLISLIKVSSLNITNNGTSIARANQNITVTLVTDGTDLGNFAGILLGKNIADTNPSTVTVNTDIPGTAIFTTTVLSTDTNGNITFSITATNSSASQLVVTNENITDGSFVTVDTVKPIITLNGSSTDTVLQGNNYTDLGANVSDSNNSLYNEIVNASTTNLDTSSLGAQNITYSAPADAAGNVPDPINRTVTVLAKPLGIDTLTITSTNSENSLYATTGDEITITLDANGTIGSATTISIASISLQYTLVNDRLTTTYVVNSSLADTTNLGFTITAYNEDNTTSRTFTATNLNGSNIIIDKTSPTIVLEGINNTIVPTNSSYTDAGATASDPSYASNIPVTGTSTNFDVTQAGNYTFTYTAPDDEAGNPGPSITRNVVVKDTPPIGITTFTIETKTGYAKAGDEINFFLLVNNTIDDHTFQIPNTTITNERASGNELYIDVQVLNNATESNATFTITIENVNGTSLTITEDDLTSSNVFIDTIPPRIATDDGGPADYFIVNGTKNPTIRNVTVTDGDLNYSGNYTLSTPNGPVNADINGSVYNYTYTADDDNAGNPGDRLTRIITIVDADPIIIRSLSIGSDSNNNFANAGKTITVTLETDGSDLGNFTVTMLGRSIAKTDVTSGATTFETIVLSDDPNGKATFSITATNSSGNRIFVTDLDTNDSSSVIIDTVKPTIELITNPTVEVFEGETYADLGVTVSDDTDSSYSPTITATTLDTSVLGAQNITYSATADAAGNVPDPINRTVTVLAKPLGIDTLTITSTNSKNSLYATTGDELTITLDANGTISSTTTISIASIPLQYTLVNDRLTATYVVDSSLVDTTNLGFTITAYNEDNTTSRTFTATNLDGSNIIIDKTSPTIALEGINNTIVPTNGSYTDAGATASDPSYASNIPVTGTSTDFNINKSGDYTFTYTAPDDAAGNPGPSITRNVMVKDIPPIGIDTFTIETNTGYAKAGDVVNFYLLVNNTIASYTFQMPNANITNDRESGNELYIDIDVLNNATESNATFTITIENVNGTSLTITEDDLTSSNVFIDTIPPRIATDDGGPADYFIVNGTDPTIRNVTVTDGDLNYSGNYTLVTPNGPVNANINGSVYNYTYTADDDNAGNPGPSLSRIITIIDADPITIRSLSIASNSGNNFANEGKTIIVTLETDGSDLGNFTVTMLGRSIAKADVTSGATTFETNVLSDDPNGKATFSIVATNSSGNRIFVTDLDTNDSSSVIIDTVKPTIELITNPTVEVFEGETYADLGVTVSDDTDSSYSPTITATTLDTSVLGAQNITYSATADAAGNVPDPINRTVTVLAKPLGIDTLTITSTNSKNSLYATTDDEITITLDANGTIGSATTIQIESIQLTPIFTNDRLTASYTVDSSLADTINLGFTITAYNEDNKTSRTFTATNLDGSNIIIDKTSPTIALEGINNTIVPTNSSYTDAGATASDPSYANNIPVTGTSTNFDVTQAGDYTFTYTAPDDAAGNPGPSITRNVMVKDIPPIGIDTFTIESNTGYAKAGDLINFYLLVNNTIASYTFQMPNVNITNDRESGSELYIDVEVLNNAIESNATFTITIENVNGTSLTITEDDLTASNVFIDTIPPRIATDDGGPADYFLVNGTENPTIRNVTVTDGDLNYSGNYTLVTPNGIVDTSVNGSVFNYTYTADDDNAGNPGDRLTRIITIIDAPLIDITSLSITSSPGNPNFANADNTITLRLQTDSDDLGNFTGTLLGKEFTNTTSGGTATFTVPVSSSDANGNVTFSIVVTNSSGGRVSFTESDLDTDSFVTIDTISPTISLNGENDTVVALGEPYTYLGATAYDLSYGNTQVSTTDRVNVNQLGHYTLHYTAPTDAAGNTGPTIIQIVEVLDAPPIDIQTFTIRNGGDSSSLYAKAGDDLSIQLSINYTIASYTATIFGIEQSESNQNSNGFLISQQVPYDLAIEENATFSITIVDENGLPNTITQNTLITSSQLPPDNIFIDTISPIVELSTQQISISVNDTIPDITATITEGDPNYGEKTITIPGSNISASDDVDIGTVGAYVFTYTARDDTAGNPGQSDTISIVVKNDIQNATTVLNSSVIADTPQSFSDDIIIAEIHNDDGDSNNTLSLNAPIVELDVSGITDPAPGTNNYIMRYTHPLDLTVHNTISAQIELGTVLEFNTDDTTIRHNFTIHYVENDDPNDDVIRIGHTDINYELDTHAIGITFERVRTPFNVSITNPSGVYVPVKSFEFTTTTENSANAWDILDGDSTYSGTLYTYDKSTRTVTVWTSHLSDVRLNSTSSSGGDESDSNSPTLGKASSGAQLVTNGFEYNGLTVNVGRYHTEFPLIGTNVGDINTIKMKVYDSAGPTGVKRVEFALGVPDIGLYHEAEAFVEVWMQRDSVAVQETIIVDELNLLENSDVSATVSQTSCSDDAQQCLLVELQYSYREPPAYNTISIKPVDWDNNAHQFYFNDGIHVDGDSINLPKEITISASHAADTTHAGETLHLVQIDRAEHLWVDQYGYQWMIIGNTVRQITVPEYLVPDDNTYGTLHGPDRNHPEFASSVYAEQQKAQETLAEILGHATIMKPLPENGGTIYFDATGTDSRSGDSFKLLLELETARMQQLSNLLYDDIN